MHPWSAWSWTKQPPAPPETEKERAERERLIQEYLARGGVIRKLPPKWATLG